MIKATVYAITYSSNADLDDEDIADYLHIKPWLATSLEHAMTLAQRDFNEFDIFESGQEKPPTLQWMTSHPDIQPRVWTAITELDGLTYKIHECEVEQP